MTIENQQQVESSATTNEVLTGLPTYGLEDLLARPKPEWAVHNVQQARGWGVIHSEPGVGKTFIMLDMMYRQAMGAKDWFGHHIGRRRKTLYIIAEGVDFFAQRMGAWLATGSIVNGTDKLADCMKEADQWFRIHDQAFDILNPLHIEQVITTAKNMGAENIVIDTYARMMLAGDENSALDSGLAVKHIDHMWRAIDGFVWLVHHDNKGGQLRGSTALNGAADVRLQVAMDQVQQLVITHQKAKNGPKQTPMTAILQPVHDFDSAIIVPSGSPAPAPAWNDGISYNDRSF